MTNKKWLCPTLVIVGLMVAVVGIITSNWIFVIAGVIVLVSGLIVCAGKDVSSEKYETKEEIKEVKPEPIIEPEVIVAEEKIEEAIEPVGIEREEDDGIEVAEEVENIEEKPTQV
ncbi:MAG: hypothetical protein WCX88_00900 [Patescibacteria group bacterium]